MWPVKHVARHCLFSSSVPRTPRYGYCFIISLTRARARALSLSPCYPLSLVIGRNVDRMKEKRPSNNKEEKKKRKNGKNVDRMKDKRPSNNKKEKKKEKTINSALAKHWIERQRLLFRVLYDAQRRDALSPQGRRNVYRTLSSLYESSPHGHSIQIRLRKWVFDSTTPARFDDVLILWAV